MWTHLLNSLCCRSLIVSWSLISMPSINEFCFCLCNCQQTSCSSCLAMHPLFLDIYKTQLKLSAFLFLNGLQDSSNNRFWPKLSTTGFVSSLKVVFLLEETLQRLNASFFLFIFIFQSLRHRRADWAAARRCLSHPRGSQVSSSSRAPAPLHRHPAVRKPFSKHAPNLSPSKLRNNFLHTRHAFLAHLWVSAGIK